MAEMTQLRGFDLDGETSRAWKAFAGRLADHVADMADADTLTLGLVGLPTEATGFDSTEVTFTGVGDSSVRAVVAVGLPTETSQPEGASTAGLERELEGALATLGWQRPDGQASTASTPTTTLLQAEQLAPRREADHLSSLTVRLLCEVLGAVHPVFLRITGAPEMLDLAPDGATPLGVEDLEPPQVTEPADSAHLRELVTQTIAAELGAEPTRDADGDIVLEVGTARVFIRVLDHTPVISIFGRLVHDITHPFEAPAVVESLNADYSFVKFSLGDDSVLAGVHLPATPFVPAHLLRMMATFAELADNLDDELVRRLGGRREIETPADEALGAAEPDGLPPELLTLLSLDPDGAGLEAEQTAEVCGYDTALASQLLQIARGQEAVWQEAAEQGADDPDEIARCAEEAAGWKATRRSLEDALALIEASGD